MVGITKVLTRVPKNVFLLIHFNPFVNFRKNVLHVFTVITVYQVINKNKHVAFNSQGSRTGQLDFCN
jgi:hypothetical protein